MGSKAGKHGPKSRLYRLEKFESSLELAEDFIGESAAYTEHAEVFAEEKYKRAVSMINDSITTTKRQIAIILDTVYSDIEKELGE